MNMDFMNEYYEHMRADEIDRLVEQRNDECEECIANLVSARLALLEELGLSYLFDRSRKLDEKEEKLWLLFDKIYSIELTVRYAFAKGGYILGAEDRERMLL